MGLQHDDGEARKRADHRSSRWHVAASGIDGDNDDNDGYFVNDVDHRNDSDDGHGHDGHCHDRYQLYINAIRIDTSNLGLSPIR